MKRIAIFLGVIAAIAIAVYAIPLVMFNEEEIGRITSPDSVVDAVLTRQEGGATVAVGYKIYIVPAGEPAPLRRGIFSYDNFRADRVKDLNHSWVRPQLLRITYTDAQIFRFVNFWSSGDVQNFGYEVELELAKVTPGDDIETPGQQSAADATR